MQARVHGDGALEIEGGELESYRSRENKAKAAQGKVTGVEISGRFRLGLGNFTNLPPYLPISTKTCLNLFIS